MPSDANSARLPTATRRPSTIPTTPLPVSEVKSADCAERQAAFLGAAHDRGRQRVLAAAFEAGGEAQQLVLAERGRSR